MKKIILLSCVLIFTSCGNDGLNGNNGLDGNNGLNGKSCSVRQLSNGALITCPDGSNAIIYNGKYSGPDKNNDK